MKFSIRKQKYGGRGLSYAIYLHRPWRRAVFLAYSWSFSSAWRACQLIKQSRLKGREGELADV